MKKERDQNVDIYRGIAILLVLVGHVFWLDKIGPLIYSFHLPLFFMVTGFFIDRSSEKYKFLSYLNNKFQSILVPYILALIVNLLFVQTIKFYELGWRETLGEFAAIFVFSNSALIESAKYQIYYWFMPFFFLYSICLYLVYRYLYRFIKVVLVVSLVLSYVIYKYHSATNYDTDTVPWAVDKIILVIPLGIIGNEIWKRRNFIFAHRTKIIIISGLILPIGAFGQYDMRTFILSSIFHFYFLAINGSLFVLSVSDFLDKNLSNGIYGLKKLLIFLGQNTMILYLIHGIIYPIWHGAMGSPKGYETSYNITVIAMSIFFTFVVRYMIEVINYWMARIKKI